MIIHFSFAGLPWADLELAFSAEMVKINPCLMSCRPSSCICEQTKQVQSGLLSQCLCAHLIPPYPINIHPSQSWLSPSGASTPSQWHGLMLVAIKSTAYDQRCQRQWTWPGFFFFLTLFFLISGLWFSLFPLNSAYLWVEMVNLNQISTWVYVFIWIYTFFSDNS